jgi:NAD(P)H-dependent flavin oxidoreductase YrpB (nitropropane dioxygenase family)
MLGIPLWRFLLGGFRMRKVYEASFLDLANEAAALMTVSKALVDGDEDLGAIPSGQVCGRMDDIPAARELIERIVAEARTIFKSVGEEMLD